MFSTLHTAQYCTYSGLHINNITTVLHRTHQTGTVNCTNHDVRLLGVVQSVLHNMEDFIPHNSLSSMPVAICKKCFMPELSIVFSASKFSSLSHSDTGAETISKKCSMKSVTIMFLDFSSGFFIYKQYMLMMLWITIIIQPIMTCM